MIIQKITGSCDFNKITGSGHIMCVTLRTQKLYVCNQKSLQYVALCDLRDCDRE